MDLEAIAIEGLMKKVCARNAVRVLYCRYELRVFNFVLRCTGQRALA